MPEFRKRGLKLEWEVVENGLEPRAQYLAQVVLRDKDGDVIYSGEWAGAEFFGLTEEEAEYLFIPNGQSYYEGMGPEDMPLKDYRRGLRRFIDRKRKELGYK